MRADLDTLVIALYCAACALFPSERTPRRGRPQLITDNELLALMVAQMLLQCPSDRVFLRRARRRLGHLFPYLPSQSRYNERCRALAPKLVVLWKALAAETFGAGDDLRLLDTTPLPCGQSIETTRRSQLAPWAGFGYCPAHSRRYWGFKLVLLCAPDGTIFDFDLVAANTRRARGGARAARAQPDRGRHDHLRQRLRRRRLRSSRPPSCARCSCDPAAATSPTGPTRRSAGSANGSNRSSTASKTSSCSNATAAAPPPACSPASPHASSPSAPRSTSTNDSACPAANSPPTPINRSTI